MKTLRMDSADYIEWQQAAATAQRAAVIAICFFTLAAICVAYIVFAPRNDNQEQ